jgi:hypothetical protein
MRKYGDERIIAHYERWGEIYEIDIRRVFLRSNWSMEHFPQAFVKARKWMDSNSMIDSIVSVCHICISVSLGQEWTAG